MDNRKEYDPQEPISVTLPREQWDTVLSWLDYGYGYHDAKKWECLCNIKNKEMAAGQAARHDTEAARAKALHDIIEDTLSPDAPAETE